jgi:hypothetical protein
MLQRFSATCSIPIDDEDIVDAVKEALVMARGLSEEEDWDGEDEDEDE